MRTRGRSLAPLLAAVALLAACDKQADKKAVDDKKTVDKQVDDNQADTPAAEPPPPAPTVVLTLGAAKIMPKDQPDQAIEIAADGTVKLGPNPDQVLQVSTDGKVSRVDGTIVAQVGADGSVTIGGKPSGIVLDDTGLVLTAPDGKTATLRFSQDGPVLVEPPPAADMQMIAEGCGGPVARTCALVLSMYLLTPTAVVDNP